MIPFYSPYNFFNPYIQPTYFTYSHLGSYEEKKEYKATQTSVKHQQQQNLYQVQENSNENDQKIKLKIEQLQKQSYQVTKRLWSQEQDKLLICSVQEQNLNWKQISILLKRRNPKMCYNRYKRLCKKKKVLWTKHEDQKLKYLVQQRKLKWKHLQKHFEKRKAKQLRQRYLNFLRPNISRQPWTLKQDLKLVQCINQMGKKWKMIQKVLTNRSQNQIKNRYYGRIQHILKKKDKFSNQINPQ